MVEYFLQTENNVIEMYLYLNGKAFTLHCWVKKKIKLQNTMHCMSSFLLKRKGCHTKRKNLEGTVPKC